MLKLVPLQSETSLKDIREWHKYLSDQDVALLGPEILLHVVSFRAASIRFLQSFYALFLYVRDADSVHPEDIVKDMQELMFFLTKSQLESAMLLPLLEKARTRNIFEITLALLR